MTNRRMKPVQNDGDDIDDNRKMVDDDWHVDIVDVGRVWLAEVFR